jgi:hypothetical protein
LPDGSRLVYERNGQNQVVALKRQTIQTPWLRWLGSERRFYASSGQRDKPLCNFSLTLEVNCALAS